MKKTLLAALIALFAGSASAQDAPHTLEILVHGGYHPNRVVVRAGEKVRLEFVRHETSSCSREVVFPALDLRRELPAHQSVFVDLPALAVGEYEFRCGMNMIRGTIVVEPAT
jgi:plastocyanin domain-containing protein